MIRNAKLQSVPTAVEIGVTQTIGLGIVLKATLLSELLERATAAIRARIARDEPEPVQPVQTPESELAHRTHSLIPSALADHMSRPIDDSARV